MPRVLFIHHRPQLSGAARSLALLADGLDDSWEAHAVAPEGPAADALRATGVTVHPASVPAFTHTWDVQYHGLRWLVLGRELTAVPAHVRALRRTLRDVRPDVVHVNDSVMLLSGALASRAGVPVVWHLRSSLASGGADRRSRWICRALDRFGEAAIAIDTDVGSTFALRIPVEVVLNPVAALSGRTAPLVLRPGAVSVGYFGFLRRQKGWPAVLRALRTLLDEGHPVHGVFVGGAVRPSSSFRGLRGRLLRAAGVPDEEGDFGNMVEELDLGASVTLIPFVEDPLAVMRSVDIVVFPNQGAGLGRPVLEAAALGKPVIASGSRDGAGIIVDGVTGILLAEATADRLTEALRRLVVDPAFRTQLGAAAAVRAASRTPEGAAAAVSGVWNRVRTDAENPSRWFR